MKSIFFKKNYQKCPVTIAGIDQLHSRIQNLRSALQCVESEGQFGTESRNMIKAKIVDSLFVLATEILCSNIIVYYPKLADDGSQAIVGNANNYCLSVFS